MNKLDFIKKICEKTQQTQNEVDKTIKAISEVITEQVRDKGEEIQLTGLGTFKQKVNPARKARNPFNGEEVDVKESVTIKFHLSSTIKKTRD